MKYRHDYILIENYFTNDGSACEECRFFHRWKEAHGEVMAECDVINGNSKTVWNITPEMCPVLDDLRDADAKFIADGDASASSV